MTDTGRRAAGIAIAVLAGALFALQARVNGELGERLDDGVAAALVSFGSGLALLLAFAAVSRRMRAGLHRVGAALRAGRLRWWHLAAGVSGGYVVACQGLTVASLGVAVFTIALVGGQAASGLVVDRVGIGPAGPQAVTARRVTGAALALAAVAVTVADQLGAPSALGLAVLPLVAGVGIAWQQAVIGQVGVAAGGAVPAARGAVPAAGGAVPAALVNFAGGTAVLVVAGAVLAAVRGLPDSWPADLWLYTGGPLGIVYVASATLVVRWIGVLLLGLGTVAGQLFGALLLDAAAGRLAVTTLAGAALALAAVVVTAGGALTAAGRRRRSVRMGP